KQQGSPEVAAHGQDIMREAAGLDNDGLIRDGSGRIRPAPGHPPFRPLGFHRDTCYIQVSGSDRVISINVSELRGPKFLTIARQQWYQDHFANDRGRVDWMLVADSIVRQCESKGYWNATKERREGIWRDGDDIVVNHGRGALVLEKDGSR